MKKRKTKNSLTALVMVHIATLADKSSHQRKCQVWKKSMYLDRRLAFRLT